MLRRVRDKAKIVTDSLVLKELARQGIDKDYVEFYEDYSAKHPTSKLYRDRKSKKHIAVFQGLPKVNLHGEKVTARWTFDTAKKEYTAGANLFTAIAKHTGETTVTLEGVSAVWNPQVFLDGVEQPHGIARRKKIDPTNENYSYNVLEWNYGICLRRLRLIEGTIIELWIFDKNPGGDIVIKSHVGGDLPAKGYYAIDAAGKPIKGFKVVGDEKQVPRNAWEDAAYPVIVDDTYTGYSTTSDGKTTNFGSAEETYAHVHDEVHGTVDDTGDSMYFGQQCEAGPRYNIFRCFVFFDTSSLSGSISAATLSLYGSTDNSATDFDMTVTNGQPTYPHDGLVTSDYDQSHYSGDGGHLTTNGFNTSGYNVITLNATGRGWINLAGTTKLCLRSSRDIASTTPTGDEYVYVRTAEKGAGYKPKLIVTYTPSIEGEVSISTTSSMTLNGDRIAAGIATIAAIASMSVLGSWIASGKVSVAVVSSLSLQPGQTQEGDITIAAVSSLSAEGQVFVVAGVAITVVSSLAVSGGKIRQGEITITATSSLTMAALAYVTQSLGYTGTLAAGDVLVIDVDNMTVEKNGVDDRSHFTGVFPLLYTETNELRWKDEDGSRDVTLLVAHEPRWV